MSHPCLIPSPGTTHSLDHKLLNVALPILNNLATTYLFLSTLPPLSSHNDLFFMPLNRSTSLLPQSFPARAPNTFLAFALPTLLLIIMEVST